MEKTRKLFLLIVKYYSLVNIETSSYNLAWKGNQITHNIMNAHMERKSIQTSIPDKNDFYSF